MEQLFTLAFFTSFLGAAVRTCIPLAYASLGEIYSEKAGILNIGLEANMLAGAFCSFAVAYTSGSLWLGLLGGLAGGLAVCMLHAFISVKLAQNQTICGIALNIFLLGITSYFLKILVASNSEFPQVSTFPKLAVPGLSAIPLIGDAFFNQNILVYILYVLIAVSYVLMKYTQWGNSLTAVGEHPRAADTVGIRVYRMQYMAAAINGMLGGMSGAYMVLAQLGVFTENMTAGRGYIALAVVIFGRREPIKAASAALLFGAAECMQFRMQAIGIDLPAQFMNMLPYLITVIALLGSIGKQRDPESLGKPYIRDAR
ncbi:MAG: ABC transporter permease [Candidatus Pelethousia sp.]|nr:ABC transporter permease [Candidatus Pelethousia sp.]